MPELRRILITGGCGFIGTNLIARLRSGPDSPEIRVLDNESLGTRQHIAEFDVDFMKGDIRDEAALRRALAGVDGVVHLAANTRVMDSLEDPAFNFESNVVGSFRLLMAMREAGVQRIVNASTGGAIIGEAEPPVHEEMVARPMAPYGASKLSVEGYCSAFAGAFGFQAASLRFSNVYGPRSYHKGSVVAAFFKNILRGEELVVYGDGEQTRDYVFVEDLVEGVVQALKIGKSGVFQLGTGKPTSIGDLIAHMRTAVGDEYPVRVRMEDYRDGEIKHTWCDITKARNEIGYDPHTPVEEGLRITWDWFTTAYQGA